MPKPFLNNDMIVIRILAVAIWIQFAVWTMKLPRILDKIESKPRHMHSKEADIHNMLRYIEWISSFKLFVIRKNCLKKNLLYYYFLVTSGITGLDLHIGVRKPGQDLDGHCWLTRDGEVYLDTERKISQYKIIYTRGV